MLEEKCTAVDMLVCYVRELGPGFLPHALPVLDIAVPLLKFWFHEGVRQAAGLLIPKIFSCLVESKVYEGNRPGLLILWQATAAKILEVIDLDTDIELVYQLFLCFYEVKIPSFFSLNCTWQG